MAFVRTWIALALLASLLISRAAEATAPPEAGTAFLHPDLADTHAPAPAPAQMSPAVVQIDSTPTHAKDTAAPPTHLGTDLIHNRASDNTNKEAAVTTIPLPQGSGGFDNEDYALLGDFNQDLIVLGH